MTLINNNEIIYRYSKSFFWASKFLPRNILNKVINIYSFCRIHDDLVDEGLSLNNSNDVENLKEVIKSYGVSEKIISELITGINSDINFKRYNDNYELLRYCYRVAGIVGLMMVKAMDIKSKEAKYYAIDLGIAMQLTNISRDIMQDYNNNRIYIPKDTGITEDSFKNTTEESYRKLNKVVALILLKADIYYNSSLNGFRYIPIRSRLAILVALRIYQAIGVKIKKTGSKFLSENIYISKSEKIIIIIKAIFEFLLFFILPLHNKKHNPYLHKSLKGLIDVNNEKI